MAEKKDELKMGVLEGELMVKIVLFQAKMMVLAQESGLSLGELSVALDVVKSFLEDSGIHSGVIRVDKKK